MRLSITANGRSAVERTGAQLREVLDDGVGRCERPEAVLAAIDEQRRALQARWAERVQGQAEQKAAAEEVIGSLGKERIFSNPIVTEVTAASQFHVAEDYHQNYLANNPSQPYCMFVVAPKAQKVREKFANRLKG